MPASWAVAIAAFAAARGGSTIPTSASRVRSFISASRSAPGVEVRGVEVLARGRHDAQALAGEPLVLLQVARLEGLVDRGRRECRVEVRRGPGEQLVGRALDEAADDLLPRVVGHAMERGHELVGGVERQLGHARVALARRADAHAALLGEHDERALGRVADHLAGGGHDRVGGERHREHELLERHVRLAGDLRDGALGRVAAAGDRVAAAGDRQLDRGHLVERERSGLVRADGRRGTERLGRAQPLDDRIGVGEQAGTARQDRGHHGREPGRDRRDRERHRDGETSVKPGRAPC